MKDTFDEAFEEESKEGVKEEVVETKTTDVVDGQVNEPLPFEAQAKDDIPPKTQHQDGDQKPTYEEIEQKYKSLQGMIKSQQEDRDEAIRVAEELKDKLAMAEQAKVITPKPEETVKDADLEEYIKDYAFISANEAKLRTKDLNKLKQEIIDEVSKSYNVSNEAVENLLNEDRETKAAIHLSTIVDAHPDYGKSVLKKDIVTWVDTLSPSIKKANMLIIKEGDADEVIDLIKTYKESHNIATIPIDEVHTKTPNDDRLKNLEVVKNKKAPVTGSVKGKAESYEDAFNEAASVR